MENKTLDQQIGDFDWLQRWARFSPENVAFKDADTGTSYTYAELFYLSCSIASQLKARYGVQFGDRVAMLATNEIEAIPLFFATQRLGAVLVPVNFRLTAREIEHVLEDSGAKLLIAQQTFDSTLQNVGANAMAEFRWSFEDLQKSISQSLSAFRDGSENQSVRHTARWPDRPNWFVPLLAEPTKACMILYTSGTTGAPKGAMITPKMLFWNSVNTTLRLSLSQNDVFVNFLPFFHTGGWNVLLTPFVHRGAKTILTKKFDADRILALCAEEKATIMFGVPTTMEMMSRSNLFATTDLSSIRYAIVGGEPMAIELIKTWQKKGVPIRQGFGLTEFGPNVFSLSQEDAIRKIGSIGFPNFYIDVRVVNDDGEDVAQGEIGELILKGPVCTPGYWKNEKATNDAIRDGWFHTGDLVRFDSEGYFYVAGRKKDMFISGGENVYPVEVERVLSQHPAVREVAVIGVADPKWGEVGRAYISLAAGANATAEEVLGYCSDKLAKFKIPRQIEFLADLPKGDSGKILKRVLKDQSQATVSN